MKKVIQRVILFIVELFTNVKRSGFCIETSSGHLKENIVSSK